MTSTSMSSLEEDWPFHTVEDDIKYQIIIGNNKRTGFLSSDQQILSKNNQELKLIEKKERIASAEYRRQHSSLVSKMEQLQHRQQTLGIPPKSPPKSPSKTPPKTPPNFAIRSNRRYSLPHIYHQPSVPFCNENSSSGNIPLNRSPTTNKCSHHGNINANNVEIRQDDKVFRDENPTSHTLPTQVIRNTQHLQTARRMSHEIQAETAKMALERLNTIMSESKRRATISVHVSSSDSLPSKKAIERFQKLVLKATKAQ